jgi:23S rRNA (cytosine1962-C5)-methyltransferase
MPSGRLYAVLSSSRTKNAGPFTVDRASLGIPLPMSADGRVILKPRRARPFFARHPWVLDSSIQRVEGDPQPGAEVVVLSAEGKHVAQGLYNPNSTIRVRLYRWDEGPLDESFWTTRLESAIRLREGVLPLNSGEEAAYRLVFSESDGLSGLTVDRYGQWMVAQFTSLALYHRRELFLGLLAERTGVRGIVACTERGIASREGLRAGEEDVLGPVPDGPVEIIEHGLRYRVDLRSGQKTGFYLDQRHNRTAVASYCRGRRVLDLFCFTGAFSLNAIKHGGAVEAIGIESSALAIERAREHTEINGIDQVRFEVGDVLETLERLAAEGRQFGAVICDPPKYARQVKDVEHALKGYLRLNRAALDVLAPDGILVTCSCSGLVGRDLFTDLLGQVAEQSRRPIQILEQRGQAPDHPVSASCLETEYLKCMICRVE